MESNRRLRGGPRIAIITFGVLVLSAAGATACSTHREPLTHACPTVVGRGVVGLPKLGLSPDELKTQLDC